MQEIWKILEIQGRSKLQDADESKKIGLKNIVIKSSIKVYSSYKTIIYIQF